METRQGRNFMYHTVKKENFSLWSLLRSVLSPASCSSGYQKPGKIPETSLAVGVRILMVTLTVPGSWGSHTQQHWTWRLQLRLKECKAVRSDPARTTTTTKTQLHSESSETFLQASSSSVPLMLACSSCKALKEESWVQASILEKEVPKFSPRVVM